jgi:hemoglobin
MTKIAKFEKNIRPLKKDIETLKDIQFLVDRFYETVRADPFIGSIFNTRLEGRWDMHHHKLYRFWHTVLLRRPDYFGDPVPIHFDMNIDERHFDHWLKLWINVVDDNFEGKIADRAKLRGRTMAASFLSKIKKAEAGEIN